MPDPVPVSLRPSPTAASNRRAPLRRSRGCDGGSGYALCGRSQFEARYCRKECGGGSARCPRDVFPRHEAAPLGGAAATEGTGQRPPGEPGTSASQKSGHLRFAPTLPAGAASANLKCPVLAILKCPLFRGSGATCRGQCYKALGQARRLQAADGHRYGADAAGIGGGA